MKKSYFSAIPILIIVCFIGQNIHAVRGYAIYRHLFNTKWFSASCGHFAKTRISGFFNPLFVKAFNVNMDEAEFPLSHYKTLNELFIRKLKPKNRPIDPEGIISPADGIVSIISPISAKTPFTIKGVPFNLTTFLYNKETEYDAIKKLAAEFEEGTALIIYLSPSDYHRFHFPFDCTPEKPIQITGSYESVSEKAFKSGIQPLTTNVRYKVRLSPDCMLIAVGAMCISSVKFSYQENTLQSKGSEMGYFTFGGSTIVLLFKKDTAHLNETISDTHIKFGQHIGFLKSQVLNKPYSTPEIIKN